MATQAGSTTLAALRAAAATMVWLSPSGCRPMSSGRRRNSSVSGASTTSRNRPSVQQAVRQSVRSMKNCIHGSITIEPMPTPAKARLMASPRRRTNQLGRNSDCPV